jgi:hypothetical protein
MLGCAPLALLKLWKVFDHALHVFDRLELGLRVLGLHESSDKRFDFRGEIAKVAVHDFAEELIVIAAKNDLAHVGLKVFQVFQINTVVFDFEQFVDHRLVSPLVEQRGHWIFFAVDDQKHASL